MLRARSNKPLLLVVQNLVFFSGVWNKLYGSSMKDGASVSQLTTLRDTGTSGCIAAASDALHIVICCGET